MIVATSSIHTHRPQAEDGNVQRPLGCNVAMPEDYTMHECMH
jgi:hypothetical protein